MAEAIRILILEDRQTDADLEEFELQEAGLEFTSRRVMTEKEYIEGLQAFSPHLILSDYDLPQYNGSYALAEAKRRCPDTPFILVTGAVGEDRAIEILTQGAKDYVLKNRLQRLVPAVQRAVAEAEAHKARKKAEEELLKAHKALEAKVQERTAALQNEVTVRKQIEESLRRSEEKLRMALDASGQGTWDWNLTDQELLWSEKCKALFGFSPETTVSQESFLQSIHPEDRERIEQAISRALDQKEDYDVEMRVIWPDGTIHWLGSKGKSIYLDGGKPARMIGVTHDITERRMMEDDLIRARKLESVGRLAGGIAHDFNNLLSVIQGNIELSKLKIYKKNVAQGNLHAAEMATRQAAELTKRLITFARGGDPIKRLSDIRKMITDTIRNADTEKSIEKKIFMDDDLWLVEVDEGQIRQVLRNIATNALEAMPGGGTIKVETKNVMVTSHDLLPIPEGPYVRISIEDTGEGIYEKDLPQIFDPYFSTKQRGSEKGMGLGLSVCYSILSKHEGCITVKSKQGAGSTFCIYLPAFNREKLAASRSMDGKNPAGRNKKKILVMDDEALVRDVTEQLLRVKGYDVETAADGLEAIELYMKASKTDSAFDAVFLDLSVKRGLGGVPTLERLREIDPHVRAVISSGYSDDPAIQNFSLYGFVGAITKPFTLEKLVNVIEEKT
jgi:two-component system, cell cycle sensor histidine kinase and response regulator CckA